MEVKISAVVSVPVEARFPVLASKVLAAFKVACSVGFRAVCWEPPQLLLVLLGGGVRLGLVFGVEACLRGLEGGLGLVERSLGGLDVLVGLRLRVLRGLFRLLSLLQGFSVLSSLLLFGFKILLRRTQMILRIRYTLCRFIYLALRRAPLRGLGGLGYLSARPVHL